MKKLCALLVAAALCCSLTLPAFAAEQTAAPVPAPTSASTVVQDLGNGLTVEVTTTPSASTRTPQGISGNKTWTLKDRDTLLVKIVLYASFGYNGATAWVINQSASHTIYDSAWVYSEQKMWASNNTAYLSAKLEKKLAFITLKTIIAKPSLSCTPKGQIL